MPLTPFALPMEYCLLCLFILGTVVGSFLNVCIYRIPTKETFWASLLAVVYPKSRCPRCLNSIPPWANVPILGWLMLRGRCYDCKGWISPRYPIIEFGNGALWALVYWMEVPSGFGVLLTDSGAYGPFGPTAESISGVMSPVALIHWRYFYHMVLIEALVVASFIDLDLWIIPDGCTLPAMAVGVVGAGVLGHVWLTPVWHQNAGLESSLQFWVGDSLGWFLMDSRLPDWIGQSPHLHGLAVSLAGFVVAGGIVWVARIAGQWAFGREAMGFGDVVLMAMVGSFLGWQAGVMIFFIAPMFGMIFFLAAFIFRRQRELPFGPYLSLGALATVLFWNPIWTRFAPLFGTGPVLIAWAILGAILFALLGRMVRRVLEFLGVSQYDDTIDEWTSADHLFYQSGETVDPHQGRWRNHDWPGSDSSQGRSQLDTWRNGPAGTGRW